MSLRPALATPQWIGKQAVVDHHPPRSVPAGPDVPTPRQSPWSRRHGSGATHPDAPAPTDPAALTFLAMTANPSFGAEFKAGEGGKMGAAVSMARWVNTRGERGPWSEGTTATVAA